MSFEFRPAVRENVPLLIGVAGGTGSGKTFSAMRLATGLTGGKRFAVVDTERGRARHYADQFEFDVTDLVAPFRPEKYAEAVMDADKAGYPVVVVDSMSHEWAGDGGCLDWHEAEMKGDFSKQITAWIKPMGAHKKMVTKLLQVNAHVILCFRAEEKVEVVDDPDKPGKKKVVAKKSLTALDGWFPVTHKNLPYELTASFLLMAGAPGVPRPVKLQEQHRAFVPLDKPLDETVGRALGEWAAGATSSGEGPTGDPQAGVGPEGRPADGQSSPDADQLADLAAKVIEHAPDPAKAAEAIDKHRAANDPEKHAQWLQRQYARAAGVTA